MPNKPVIPTDDYSFTFAVVEYHNYNPIRTECRYYRHAQGRATIINAKPTWNEVFQELCEKYPNAKFSIPERMPIIRYGVDGKEIK